jgi:hypothetical protein
MNIPKNLFSTFRLKSWIPFFKPKGELVIDVMAEHNIPVHEFYNFYRKNGDSQLEFVEKILNERVKEDSFSKLSNVQCAYLGLQALQSFQKEIMVETYSKEDKTA